MMKYPQPSDGLLHQSTQVGERTNLLQNNRWNPDVTFEARGANHNEYGGHPEMRRIFNAVFDATDTRVPRFFETLR